MKKVLSVAMASAMVLGMGANAFAITYNSGSNDTASWPKGFAFEGSLFVTNKDGDIIKEATTDINSNKAVDFEPGDVIWMPLYADNQKVYHVTGANTDAKDEVASYTQSFKAVSNDNAEAGIVVNNSTGWEDFYYVDNTNKVVYYTIKAGTSIPADAQKAIDANPTYRAVQIPNANVSMYNGSKTVTDPKEMFESKTSETKTPVEKTKVTLNATGGAVTNLEDIDQLKIADVVVAGANIQVTNGTGTNTGTVVATATAEQVASAFSSDVTGANKYANDITVTVSGTVGQSKLEDATQKVAIGYTVSSSTADALKANATVKVTFPKVAAVDENAGTINPGVNPSLVEETVAHGHYTGNIDKNWSINLIEKSTGVAELIEKAELYKATAVDYTSYSKYTDEIAPNAVYLKITLEDEWKTTSSETLKYYVYVANNKSNTQKTNEVWVSGKYANTDVREVSFDWTNDASKAGLWKVKEGNGIAVFDFADKAFFSVKMYEGETMYLDLGTAYDKAIAGEMDAEADSFYKFDNTNANFARTGELIIVSDDSSLVPYEIDADGNFVKVDAEYVENYAVAHTNQKVNGFVFNTKQLGNYVLSTEELGEEEEPAEPAEEPDEEPAPAEPVEETPAPETNKPNPNTGAEDFVGLAVSLAVVSVAAAGALALKK